MKLKQLLLIGILLMTACGAAAQARHPRTEHWHDRNRQFELERDTLTSGQVIFLGNSITEGFDLAYYFPLNRPVNRGISGDHIDGLLERLETSVLQLKPIRLFLMIGINDIGAGDPDSTILDNYHQLLERIRSSLPDSGVYVHSVLPTTPVWSNCPREKIVRLNARIEEMVLTSGFNWINLYPLYADADGYLRRDLTYDGLHLNEAGYRIWAEQLYQKGME